MAGGVSSSRQLTFTEDKNEAPRPGRPTGPSSSSRRTAMRGREPGKPALHDAARRRRGPEDHRRQGRRVAASTSAPTGSGWSTGAGSPGRQQLYRLPVDDLAGGRGRAAHRGEAGIDRWEWAPDSRSIYFIRPDSFDEADEGRVGRRGSPSTSRTW